MSGETDPESTVAFTLDDETSDFVVAPKPAPVPAEPTRPDVLREPRRLGALLGDHGVPSLEGPVLVSHAGNPADELLRAVVYPIASMPGSAAPYGLRLEGELTRFGIGRTSANDLVVDDFTVSKRHASIVRRTGGHWSVVDEGSTNGSFADGRKLEPGKPTTLGLLTALRFGPRARFAFLHPTTFAEYAASVRAESKRRSLPTLPLPKVLSPRERPFDAVHRTQPGGTFEPLVARIVARLRSAAVAERYVLRRDGLPPLELDMLSEVISLVEQEPRAIAEVCRVGRDGRYEVVFSREER